MTILEFRVSSMVYGSGFQPASHNFLGSNDHFIGSPENIDINIMSCNSREITVKKSQRKGFKAADQHNMRNCIKRSELQEG